MTNMGPGLHTDMRTGDMEPVGTNIGYVGTNMGLLRTSKGPVDVQ